VGKAVRVGPKGQVVIPVDIRREIGLEPGQRVEIDLQDNAVVITPIPLDLRKTLRGFFRDGPSLTEALKREHAEELERDG